MDCDILLQRDEAVKLVRDAIAAGIFNDLGSGSNVDICIITKDKVDYLRPYDVANVSGQRLVSLDCVLCINIFSHGFLHFVSLLPFFPFQPRRISIQAWDYSCAH